MTFTYSGDFSSSPRNEVRFLLADTDSTDPLLSDEEIDYALAKAEAKAAAETKLAALGLTPNDLKILLRGVS